MYHNHFHYYNLGLELIYTRTSLPDFYCTNANLMRLQRITKIGVALDSPYSEYKVN